MNDSLPRLLDLRNNYPTAGVEFEDEAEPMRLNPATPGTAEYESAKYEIRRVKTTSSALIAVGDVLLFSRMMPALEVTPCEMGAFGPVSAP